MQCRKFLRTSAARMEAPHSMRHRWNKVILQDGVLLTLARPHQTHIQFQLYENMTFYALSHFHETGPRRFEALGDGSGPTNNRFWSE